MAKFKDFMHALLNEDIDDDYVEEEEVVEEPIKNVQPTFVQPSIHTVVESDTTYNFDVPAQEEKKPSIFDGMDIEEVSKAPAKTSKIKEYHYDRSKVNNKQRRVTEDLDYSPVISPIFGNTSDDKKQFEKVHDAINLQKPTEDFSFVQVISPMYGDKMPQPKPVEEIPVKKVVEKKTDIALTDMLEKPKKEKNKQKQLFED